MRLQSPQRVGKPCWGVGGSRTGADSRQGHQPGRGLSQSQAHASAPSAQRQEGKPAPWPTTGCSCPSIPRDEIAWLPRLPSAAQGAPLRQQMGTGTRSSARQSRGLWHLGATVGAYASFLSPGLRAWGPGLLAQAGLSLTVGGTRASYLRHRHRAVSSGLCAHAHTHTQPLSLQHAPGLVTLPGLSLHSPAHMQRPVSTASVHLC